MHDIWFYDKFSPARPRSTVHIFFTWHWATMVSHMDTVAIYELGHLAAVVSHQGTAAM
jgi:hypothetical protein